MVLIRKESKTRKVLEQQQKTVGMREEEWRNVW